MLIIIVNPQTLVSTAPCEGKLVVGAGLAPDDCHHGGADDPGQCWLGLGRITAVLPLLVDLTDGGIVTEDQVVGLTVSLSGDLLQS